MCCRFVTDGTVAILVSTLFFIIPSKLPYCGYESYDIGDQATEQGQTLYPDKVHEINQYANELSCTRRTNIEMSYI